jgi:potassium efflux system protein
MTWGWLRCVLLGTVTLSVAIVGSGATVAQQPAASPPAAPAAPAAQPPASPPQPAQPAAQPAPPAPQPEPPIPPALTDSIQQLVIAVEQAEKSLERMRDLGDDISRLRDDVEDVIIRSTQVADELRPRLAAVRSQIEKLGAPPAGVQEAPAIAAERARLLAEASALDGAIKTLEITWVRARQTIDKITDLRLAMFTRSIMERMSSPLTPAPWRDLLRDAPQVSRLLGYVWADWSNTASVRSGWLTLLLLGCGGLYLGLRWLGLKLTERRRDLTRPDPNFFERAAAAAWLVPVLAGPGVLAGLALYGGLDTLGLLYYPSANITAAVLRAFVIFCVVAALISAVLATREPRWRIVDLSDKSAQRVALILKAMTAVYAADLAITSIGRTLYVPLSLSVVQSLVTSLAFAGLLAGLLMTPFVPRERVGDAGWPGQHPRWLKLPLWFAALAIVVASLLGYVALARFIAQQIVATGVVGVAFVLLFFAIRAFTRDGNGGAHAVGVVLESRFGLDGGRREQLAKLTELLFTLLLIICAIPLLLLQWGYSDADIRDWFKALIFGFEVGQFRISLARIVIGLLMFIALLFITRVVQRWLREAVLAPQRLDPGIQNSVDTAVGYAGTGLAALVALGYAGFDITSLAIVAGALSVGIGFGLQSIVNNFVSGLILLIERPVKVGDWIVVGADQGNVRKISVRYTEIETFDKATLIVPNSELISGRVFNWTHRNSVGRVTLKSSVAPTVKPQQVQAVLLAVAQRNRAVLVNPPPKAIFEGLIGGSLEFTLRVYLADISDAIDVQSDLRIAVLEELQAAGMEVRG